MKRSTGLLNFVGPTLCILCLHLPTAWAQFAPTTAWRDGRMQIQVEHVIGRSDIVLERANLDPSQAMPLGNGRLGVALWSENGLTAQLNRADTMPYRYSTGQVVIPGLKAMTAAEDYRGRLDLYHGSFEEQGAGIKVVAYVQPASDVFILDIAGVDPDRPQTAILKLWQPRTPAASAFSTVGLLAESWKDDSNPGASGRTFGSLSAITAEGRNVSLAVSDDQRSVTLTVTPFADGHFRILVASPHFQGGSAAVTRALVQQALADRDPMQHRLWWQAFWHRVGILKITSPDGSGEYLENLRNLYLFSAAAESGGAYPGSQAGVADLFSSIGDQHMWDPAAFWHWNLRMQVAANLGAGLAELNRPYFNLYRENLGNIERWTKEHMHHAAGACIPETMRFNGQGIEYETWLSKSNEVSGWNCDLASGPYYNARTLSTGAEVSLWIWQQYRMTGDVGFLRANYPVMRASAQFLMAYERPGPDGLLHTSPSNAHETQWDTQDPTTDLAARRALYPALIHAAATLHRDPALIGQLRAEIGRIPELPRTLPVPPAPAHTLPASSTILLTSADDAAGADVLADSYRPADPIRNMENIGLEPVWPYNLIGDTSPLFGLARRTYLNRPNRDGIDWSFDPVQAARLGMGDEVRRSLIALTEANQHYINGFARWGGTIPEFYVEQIGVVALALQEALVQDYDGILRVAPAVPSTWQMEGTVMAQGRTLVNVQTRQGVPSTVGLVIRISQPIRIRNPWLGQLTHVVDATSGAVILEPTKKPLLQFAAVAGHTYRIEPLPGDKPERFLAIDGSPAETVRRLGSVQIGLEARTPAATDLLKVKPDATP